MRPTTDLERRVAPFQVISDFQPSGDQPAAIEERGLVDDIRAGGPGRDRLLGFRAGAGRPDVRVRACMYNGLPPLAS